MSERTDLLTTVQRNPRCSSPPVIANDQRPATNERFTTTTSKLRGSRPAAPVAGNTDGIGQTSVDSPADVRKSCSGCGGATRTSASALCHAPYQTSFLSSRPSLVLL